MTTLIITHSVVEMQIRKEKEKWKWHKIIQKQLDEIETLREINDYLATSLAMANEIIEIIKDKVKTMESTKEEF